MEKYTISKKQLETLKHYTRMFQVSAEEIDGLCKKDLSELEIGFELGKLHNLLSNCQIEMMLLEDEIKQNK